MNLSVKEIETRAHAIWAENGMAGDTHLGDWLRAQAELMQVTSLVRQLEEDQVPEVTHLLRALLDNITAVVYVKDSLGRYLLANGRFMSRVSVARGRLDSTTDSDLFPPEQAAALRRNYQYVLATGQPIELEEVVTQEDEDRTYLSLKFPIAGRDGFPYAVCGISTDITDRKRARRSLAVQHAVTRALAESVTLTYSGPAVLQAVCETLGWDVGLFWHVDPVANLLRCAEVWHAADVAVPAFERMSRALTLPPGIGLAGQIWTGGKPIWITNVVVADNLPRAAVALEDGLHGACGFPVRNGGNMLGVIEFFSREVRPPDPDLLRVMTEIGSQISQFIERRHAEQALHERAREFDLARAIQLGLLPKVSPAVPGFTIGGASHPAQETGGDFLDFIPLPDGSLGIAIGDASGHGIGASLVMTETRALLRARATTDIDVGQILTLVNRATRRRPARRPVRHAVLRPARPRNPDPHLQ